MSQLRHWKQRWNPTADLVFTKRMRLGLTAEVPFVNAGDPVPKDHPRLNRARLKRWWDAGYLALANWVDPMEARRKAAVLDGDGPEVFDPRAKGTVVLDPRIDMVQPLDSHFRHTGRGWFEVTLPDGTTQKVRGQAAALALLEE